MEQATIHLERKKTYSDVLRSYKVFIDNEQVSTIRNGESCSFQVNPGRHDIFLTIDWCSSQHLFINAAPGEQIKLTCQGRNAALALYYSTLGFRRYIKLYQES